MKTSKILALILAMAMVFGLLAACGSQEASAPAESAPAEESVAAQEEAPVEEEIDFKKAARVVGEKALEMLPLKDLTAVTGYVRGGCTSVGMKKKFRTTVQEDAMLLEHIVVSGGRLGLQLVLNPDDLLRAAEAEYADVIVSK